MPAPATIADGQPLLDHLASGSLAPVYLVTTGEPEGGGGGRRRRDDDPPAADPQALIEATRAIEAAALSGGDASLDHVSIDYIDGDLDGSGVHQRIASECRSLSLFGGRRVITVVHCEELDWQGGGAKGDKGSRGRGGKPGGADPLEAVIDAIDPERPAEFVLILVAQKFDKRRRSYKQLAAKGVIVGCRPITPLFLQNYLEAQAREHAIRVDRPVAQRIWDRLGGGDPARLKQTADRLLLDVGPRGHLTVKIVEAVVPIDREAAIWAITDALGQSDLVRAMEVLHLLLRHGSDALSVVGFLASHYRTAMTVHAAHARGLSEREIAQASGLHPFRVKKMMEQVRRLSPERIATAVRAVDEAEGAVKATAIGERKLVESMWLERLLVSLARGRALLDDPAPRPSQAL